MQNNLFVTQEISMQESMMGFKRSIIHLDGHNVEINKDGSEIVQPFEWEKITGQGMPVKGRKGQFGDLYIQFEIKFPRTLSPSQKAYVKEIFPDDEQDELDKIVGENN